MIEQGMWSGESHGNLGLNPSPLLDWLGSPRSLQLQGVPGPLEGCELIAGFLPKGGGMEKLVNEVSLCCAFLQLSLKELICVLPGGDGADVALSQFLSPAPFHVA